MLSKKIVLYTLVMIKINSVTINTSEIIAAQKPKKNDLSKLEKKIETKHNSEGHSYFTARPETYLNAIYKNNYVEIMQLFQKKPNINISAEGKTPQ